MKVKLLFLAILSIFPVFGSAQIFQENWDGNGPGISAWTLIDVDRNVPNSSIASLFPNAWDILTPADITSLTSNVASSTSYYTPAGTSNDWLISPIVAVSGTTPKLVWQAKAQDADFRDGYKVMVSLNGGNTVADFTETLFTIADENSDWIERNVDLTAYAGKNIRFAFVNNSTDDFILHVDNIKVVNNYVPLALPACPVLTLPANNATNVTYLPSAAFSWNAVSGAQSYDVYLDGVLLGNTTATDVTITGLDGSTTYKWKVIAKNISGDSAGCTESTFTTTASPAAPYCGPLSFIDSFFGADGDEPITNVNFAGINNPTDPTEYVGNYHLFYLDKTATVTPGSTYTMTLQGNTAGAYTSNFAAFIDWNQNNILDDAGEVYPFTQTLTDSDGTDGQQVTLSITVPNNAKAGKTRLRIKKNYEDLSDDLLDPCLGGDYGQAQDYSVNVAALAVNESGAKTVRFYPNPVTDYLNLETDTNAKSAEVYDMSGKLVLSLKLNSTRSKLNLSSLARGTYLVKIQLDNDVKTIKVVKK